MKRLGCVLPSRPNHIKELGSALNVDPLCILHRMPSPKFMFKTIWWTSNHVPRQRLLQYCPGASKQGLYATILHMYAPLIDSSVGKESTCNAGDPSSIPGSGRSAGGGIGYPLEYSWASLVAQLVNNLPAMRETWVRSLGCEDPLEKGKATHSSILAWRIP